MNDLEVSFFVGFFTCMICDVVFSICNFLIQKSLQLRAERKYMKLLKGESHETYQNDRNP